MSKGSLYQRIMNIRSKAEIYAYTADERYAYLEGHRDARHAAAEMVLSDASERGENVREIINGSREGKADQGDSGGQ
jgi:ribosome modulation factor